MSPITAAHSILHRRRARTISRYRKAAGVYASGATLKHMPEQNARQAVIDQMDKDTAGNLGVGKTYENIRHDQGISLPR